MSIQREVIYEMDGDQWCAHFDDFTNLQESQAGFGYTKEEALKALEESMEIESTPEIPKRISDIMWWGYLHSNGTVQLKRWFGDHKDYTDDCEGNPFTTRVVSPFKADTRDEAMKLLIERLA